MKMKDIPIFGERDLSDKPNDLSDKLKGFMKINIDSLPPNFFLSPSYVKNGAGMELVEFSVIPIPENSHMVLSQNNAVVNFEIDSPKITNAIMSLDAKEE